MNHSKIRQNKTSFMSQLEYCQMDYLFCSRAEKKEKGEGKKRSRKIE